MDLICDEVRNNFCKVNIDGGKDLDVALISNDNEFTNSSDEIYDTFFEMVPLNQFDGIIEELNFASEYDNNTWSDIFPREYYENPQYLRKIQLEFQNLTKIKSSAFIGAYNLMEIDLDHNQILYIGEDALIDLQNLTIFSLSRNNLTIIRSNTFAGAINLRRLHLNQNKIEHIEDGAFNLPNLENILLQNNQLKKLSGSIFIGTPRLKEAVLEDNELTHINDAFTHLHGLQVLILDYNQIEDITLNKFAQLAELKHLSLRKSGFHLKQNGEIDEKNYINSTSKLEVLDLAENGLTDSKIFLQLRMFHRMEIINLEFNEFPEIQHIFELKKEFPMIQIINLSYNPIRCKWVHHFVDHLKHNNVKVFPWLYSFDGCIPDDDIYS